MMQVFFALLLAVSAPDLSSVMQAMHVPGMQVVVVDDGRIAASQVYGVRDVATKAPVDEHTRFEIGSITKQFTAAAILQLKEQGKLSLDDRLGKYLPQYARGKNITLREMLLQVSGIPNYTDTKAFKALVQQRDGKFVLVKNGSLESVLGLISSKPLDFAPGTKWEYSNSNYYLLGYVVQRASGERWEDYIAHHIFAPAAMTESSFMENEANIADMATGYTLGKKLVPTGTFAGWAGGAGAIVSTANDVAKWDLALLADKILNQQDRGLMMSPGTLRALDGHYGFGWIVDTYDTRPRVWHNGGTLGFNASNQYYPDDRQIVIVLTNFSGGADSIAQKAFDDLHPALAAAKTKAAPGEDPQVTAKAKLLWSQFVAGTPDMSLFTDNAKKAFTPDVLASAKSTFSTLGEAKSWTYEGKKSANGMTVYAYRVAFASGAALNVYMGLAPDGKVAMYYAAPG